MNFREQMLLLVLTRTYLQGVYVRQLTHNRAHVMLNCGKLD